MIDFRGANLEDKGWVDGLLAQGGEWGCEYTFANLFCWGPSFCQQIARVEGFLAVRLRGILGCAYLWPVGRGDVAPVLRRLEEDHRRVCDGPFRLVCVARNHLEELEALFPGEYEVAPDRGGFDYLYRVDKLADLKGKKLHGKRNHIHRFDDAWPAWSFEPITAENLDQCLQMEAQWQEGRQGDAAEGSAVSRALENFEALGLDGGLVRAGGRVVAFALGSRLNDKVYDVHFEKALGEVQGAYAVINREFAAWVRRTYPGVEYLNREDDMGVEGLRRAKESYYPDLMLEKFTATKK